MANEQERLVVALEARVNQFEKAFNRANKSANDNFSQIERRAKQSGDRMEKTMAGAASRVGSVLKTFGTGFAGGILGGLSVAGLQRIAKGIGDVANSVAMIGSQAKMAGLTTKAFQELGYVASQSRIGVDVLADGMKELQLRADEFITTGTGSGAESFQRLGYNAQQLKEKLKDPSAFLVDIIARLQQLDKAAQIRIADELFGGQAGERFVELIGKGADGIRQMIQEANAFGLVLSDDVIAHADEIDRKFNLISRTIGTRMKGAIVSAASELMTFMDKMKDVEERQSSTLGDQLADIGMRRMQNENAILKLKDTKENTIGGTLLGAGIDKQIEAYEKENAALGEKERRILDILEDRDRKAAADAKAAKDAVPDISKLNTAVAKTKNAADAGAKGMQSYADAIRALKGEIPELAAEVAKLDARAKIDKAYNAALKNASSIGQVNQAYALRQQALASLGRMVPDASGKLVDPSEEARRKAHEQIDAYGDIIAEAQEFITSQRQEATALGMSKDAAAAYRYEQEMLNQAKREGIELTPKQRQEIAQYAQGMAHAEKTTQQFAQAQEDAAELSKFFGDSAIDALTGIANGSMTAMDALRQLIAALAKMALQAAFLGEGPLAGSLKGTGGLFGNLGKRLLSSTSPAAVSAGTGSPVQLIAPEQSFVPTPASTEQTFAAPLGAVERSPLAPIQDAAKQAVQQTVEGLRGTIGPEITKAVAPASTGGNFAADLLSAKGNRKNFVNAFYQAGRGAGLNDTQARLMAAQAAHESASGKSAPGFNYFGIKAGKSWKGDTQRLNTWEEINGRKVRIKDDFRKYASPEDAIRDRMAFMERNFAKANNSPDIDSAIANLRNGRFGAYATDSKYAGKLQPYLRDINADLIQQTGRPKETVPPGLDVNSTGSIQQAQQQAEAVKQQIEAQRQLAQQMQATQQATTAMQPPLQGIGQTATQVVPNLGGMTQGMTSLIGPLMQGPGAASSFGGALQQLIQQLMSAPMGGAGGIFGSLLGLAGGGEVAGPGTSTSDSIPAMLSDGEFVVNAKATKKHRAALEAINSGKRLALASGGFVGGSSFANNYAPTLNINVAGSGNQRQDARLADRIADRVSTAMADPFRRSESQKLAQLATDLRGTGGRYT